MNAHGSPYDHVALQVDFSSAIAAAAQVGASVAVVFAGLLAVQLLLHVLSDGAVSQFLSGDAFAGSDGSDAAGGGDGDVRFEGTAREGKFRRIETAPRGATRPIYREKFRQRRERRRRDVEELGFNPRLGIDVVSGEWKDDPRDRARWKRNRQRDVE